MPLKRRLVTQGPQHLPAWHRTGPAGQEAERAGGKGRQEPLLWMSRLSGQAGVQLLCRRISGGSGRRCLVLGAGVLRAETEGRRVEESFEGGGWGFAGSGSLSLPMEGTLAGESLAVSRTLLALRGPTLWGQQSPRQ